MKRLLFLIAMLPIVGMAQITTPTARRVVSSVSGSAGSPTVSITRTSAPAVSGVTAQGVDVAISGSDDILDFGGLMGGKIALTWSGTGSVNHQSLQPFVARATNSGTGRIDFANGVTSSVTNTGGGILQAPQSFAGVIQNTGASVIGQGAVVFADWFQSGTAAVSTYSALYQGRFRNFSGTPSTAAVYGLYLTGWTKAGGSTVTTSSGIEIDSSIDIGTTSWAIHSTSASPSLLSGALTAPTYNTSTNCADSAGAAACGSASAGAFVVDATTTSTIVSTTAVTANSEINLTVDSSLNTRLGITCNTQSSLVLGTPRVTARTAGISFTVTIDAGPTTNPLCINYKLTN